MIVLERLAYREINSWSCLESGRSSLISTQTDIKALLLTTVLFLNQFISVKFNSEENREGVELRK